MSAGTTAGPWWEPVWAVIEEARRRAHRRRMTYFIAASALVALAALLYASRHTGGRADSLSPRTVRIDGAEVRALPKNGGLVLMAVEPNAQHEGPSGWYGISAVGRTGHLRTLVRCPGRRRWCGDLESVDWARDGERLAFGVTSVAARNPANGLRVIDLRTHRDRQLVRQGQFGEYDWYDIDWASDGRRIAYATNGHIALINADGSGRRILQTGSVGHDHSPSWSPDGRWLAFSSRHDGRSSVYVIAADGSGRRMVAPDGAAPAWSPHGKRIAFSGLDGIQYVSPNGVLLSPGIPLRPRVPVGIDAAPVWSPDGTKIAMSKRRNGTWVMNADGSGLRRITQYGADPLGFSQRPRPAWRPRPRRKSAG